MFLAILFLTIFPSTIGTELRGDRQLTVNTRCWIKDWAHVVNSSPYNYIVRGFTGDGVFDRSKAPNSKRCIEWNEPLTVLKTTWINDSANGKEFHTKIKYGITNNEYVAKDTDVTIKFKANVTADTTGKAQLMIETFLKPRWDSPMYLNATGDRIGAKYEMNVWLWRADKTSAEVRAEMQGFKYKWMANVGDFVVFYKYDAEGVDGNNKKNVFRFRAIKTYWNNQVLPRQESYRVNLKMIWKAIHNKFPVRVAANLQNFTLTGEEKYTNIGFGVNQKTSDDAKKPGGVGSKGTITFSEFSVNM